MRNDRFLDGWHLLWLALAMTMQLKGVIIYSRDAPKRAFDFSFYRTSHLIHPHIIAPVLHSHQQCIVLRLPTVLYHVSLSSLGPFDKVLVLVCCDLQCFDRECVVYTHLVVLVHTSLSA